MDYATNVSQYHEAHGQVKPSEQKEDLKALNRGAKMPGFIGLTLHQRLRQQPFVA